MLYPRPYFGDVVVTPLLAFGQLMVATTFPLDMNRSEFYGEPVNNSV